MGDHFREGTKKGRNARASSPVMLTKSRLVVACGYFHRDAEPSKGYAPPWAIVRGEVSFDVGEDVPRVRVIGHCDVKEASVEYVVVCPEGKDDQKED